MEHDDLAVPVREFVAAAPMPDAMFRVVPSESLILRSPMSRETPLEKRIEAAEDQLYYCLTGLEQYAQLLATEAETLGQPNAALRARLIASDAVSRLGNLERAKEWQLKLHEAASTWPALRRRVQMLLATTCDRRGERTESMRWISLACVDWSEDDRPAWRAEALMVFALMSASRSHVDYSLARHAVAAVEAHCSPLLLSVTLANFAEVAADCDDLAIATEFATRAAQVLREHPDVTVPLTLDSMALALLSVGETEAAIELLNQALVLEVYLGCSDVQGDPWLSMAQALLLQGDAQAALAMLDHPRRANWAAKSTWMRSRDRKQRALTLAGLGRWQEAFTALLDHCEVYESVRSVEGDRATAESETRQVANEERRRAARFEQLALTDTLTSLPNRRQVDLWLSGGGPPLHIAIVDLDHFKRVNDTYSHAAGDLVLQRIGETLLSGMLSMTRDSSGSRVGRLGGEEFIVIWTNVDVDSVTQHAHGLLERIRSVRFPEIDPDLVITASIGLAFHHGSVSGSQLLAEADRSLYIAKDSGRDQVVSAGPKEKAVEPVD